MHWSRRRFLQSLLLLSGVSVRYPQAASSAIDKTSGKHTRVIHSSGERIPAVGLGSWLTFGIDPTDSVDLKQRCAIMHEFLRAGGGMLDSSPMYGTAEEVIGLCLSQMKQKQALFSATKVWTLGLRQGFLQMQRSLHLWRQPRFDLMQVHNLLDWETHLPALQEMKQRGEVRYIGVTTSHGRRHAELEKIMQSQQIDFVQLTYNMLDREAEERLLPMASDLGISVIVNRPYQRGGLFDYVGSRVLPGWAGEIGCTTWAQVFLKFIISHPSVTCAIPATTRLDHLHENMQVAHAELPDKAMRKTMVRYLETL